MEKNDTTKSPTPVVGKDNTFDFSEAIRNLNAGFKIHKLEWEDREFYGVVHDGVLKLHKPDKKFYVWSISEGDLTGDDYIILKKTYEQDPRTKS